ncbi:hypothetical protein GGR52DRAFT_531388 [Hypoxylon sp. FL1284]|nr:hypothetical protein GGR52DRAFT_531388 [Hypoxylon sp. FL1284]
MALSNRTRISGVKFNYIENELTDIAQNATIVILTTCQGTWKTSKFGESLRLSYPLAHFEYIQLCRCRMEEDGKYTDEQAGRCHIIPPQQTEETISHARPAFIACLFASHGDGNSNYLSLQKPGRDGKKKVLDHIDSALARLRHKIDPRTIEEMRAERRGQECAQDASSMPDSEMPGRVYMYKYNGKDFQVGWEEVQNLIEQHFDG